MIYMFSRAKKFKSDLRNWNVNNAKNMGFMFCDTNSFNRRLAPKRR